jgi:hypothetical protein
VRMHATSIELVLTPRPPLSVDLELWAAEKERNYFREVFGCDLAAVAAA